MITRDEAKSQVLRLTPLIAFPRVKEALTDLVDAVQTAKTTVIAKQVIDDILDSADERSRCPLASYIKRRIYDAQAEPQKPNDCVRCNGTGWILGWYVAELFNPNPDARPRKLTDVHSEREALQWEAQHCSERERVYSAMSRCACSNPQQGERSAA